MSSASDLSLDTANDLEDDQLSTDTVDFLNHDSLVESIAQSIVNEVITQAEDIAEIGSTLNDTDHDAEEAGCSEILPDPDVPSTATECASTEARPPNPHGSLHLTPICVLNVTMFNDSVNHTVTRNSIRGAEPNLTLQTLPPEAEAMFEVETVDSLTALEMNEEIINVSPSESMEDVDDSDMMLRNIAELALTYGETVDQLLEQEASLLTNELNELIAGIDQAQNILDSAISAPRPTASTTQDRNNAQLCPVLLPHNNMVETEIREGLLELSRMLTLVNMEYATPRRNADLELSRGLRDSEVKTRANTNSSRSNEKIKREDLARIISELESSLPKRYEATKTEMKNITEAVNALNESSSHLLTLGLDALPEQNDHTTKLDHDNEEIVTNVTEPDNTLEEDVTKERSSNGLDDCPIASTQVEVNEKPEHSSDNVDDNTNATTHDGVNEKPDLPSVNIDDNTNATTYDEVTGKPELPSVNIDDNTNATTHDEVNGKPELPSVNIDDNTNATTHNEVNEKPELPSVNIDDNTNATTHDGVNKKPELLSVNTGDHTNAKTQDEINVKQEHSAPLMGDYPNATEQKQVNKKQELPPTNPENKTKTIMQEEGNVKQQLTFINTNDNTNASVQEEVNEKNNCDTSHEADSNTTKSPEVVLNAPSISVHDKDYESPASHDNTNATTQEEGNKKNIGDTSHEADSNTSENPEVILNAPSMCVRDVDCGSPTSDDQDQIPLSCYESQESLLIMYGCELNITEEASRIVREMADNAVSLHELQSTPDDFQAEAALLVNKLVDDVVNIALAKVQQTKKPATTKQRAPEPPQQEEATQKVQTNGVGDVLGASPCEERTLTGLDTGVGTSMPTSISDQSSNKKQKLSFHQRMRNAFVNTFSRRRRKGTKNSQ